jgi:hypothetical protein
MTWYAAHIISYVKFKDGVQDKFPLWENVVLIEADSEDVAFIEAEHIGKSEYDDSEDPDENGDMTWDGRPAFWVYAGVRKLTVCHTTSSIAAEDGIDESVPGFTPGHGTEVSYSAMEVSTEQELEKLVNGEPVTVLYES